MEDCSRPDHDRLVGQGSNFRGTFLLGEKISVRAGITAIAHELVRPN